MASPSVRGISLLGSTSRGGAAEPFTPTTADTLGLTDSASFTRIISTRSTTDTLGLTDDAAIVRGAFAITFDTIGLTDSSSAASVDVRTTTDRLPLIDVPIRWDSTAGHLDIRGLATRGVSSRGGANAGLVTVDYLGGHDQDATARLAQQITPPESERLYLSDNAQQGKQAVSDTLHMQDNDPDWYSLHQTRTRDQTDNLPLTDALSVTDRSQRTVTDMVWLRDAPGFTTGPRSQIRNARVLSQVWGENINGATHPNGVTAAAVDMAPQRADSSWPTVINDTVGTKSQALDGSSKLMSGGDLGFFCRLRDGRTLMVAGDNFGPKCPTGDVHGHPSIGITNTVFGEQQYYRPSACAITSTTRAQLDSGIVIDGWHRYFYIANNSAAVVSQRVGSVAPLQTEVTYVGTSPNRIATYPQRYYVYGDGVTLPSNASGDLAVYPMITSPGIGTGFFQGTASDLTNWGHTIVFPTTLTKPIGSAALNVADVDGNPPASLDAVAVDIDAGLGTYYLYMHAKASNGRGFYTARCQLTHLGTILSLNNWSWRTANAWSIADINSNDNADALLQCAETNFLNFLSAGFSIRYHPTFNGGTWINMYVGGTGTSSLGGGTRFTYRTAPKPEGPWSAERWIDGFDGALATSTNVDSAIYPYQANIWPDVDDPDTLYFTFSTGGDFNAPDPTVHTYVDDGTGHCTRWRSHVHQAFAHTNANIGCGLTLTQHNAVQSAIASGTETAGNGYSVPYAVFLAKAATTTSITEAENTNDTLGFTDSSSVHSPLSTRPVADSLSFSDPASFIFTGQNLRDTTDQLNLADTLTTSAAFTETPTDLLACTETASTAGTPTALDEFPLTDVAVFPVSTLNVSTVDSLGPFFDDATTLATLLAFATDTLTCSDSVTTRVSALNFEWEVGPLHRNWSASLSSASWTITEPHAPAWTSRQRPENWQATLAKPNTEVT